METVIDTLIPDLSINALALTSILVIVVSIFSLMAGLTGVMVTDSFQFVIAMLGSIVLAHYAIQKVDGMSGLIDSYKALNDEAALNMVPSFGTANPKLKLYNYMCNTVPYAVPCNITTTSSVVNQGIQLNFDGAAGASAECVGGLCTALTISRPTNGGNSNGGQEGVSYSKVFASGPDGAPYICKSSELSHRVTCSPDSFNQYCSCQINQETGTVQLFASEDELNFIEILHLTGAQFFAYVGIMWWASWYPGAEAGGGGFIAQRMMACKDEKNAVFATLWYVIAHYCLRPWPWILTALVAHLLYPDLDQVLDFK